MPLRWLGQDSALGLLRALLVASLIMPALLFIGFAGITYQVAMEDARRDLEHISQIAREHAIKVLATEVQVAARVEDLVQDLNADAIRSSQS